MDLSERARHLVFRFHDIISPLGNCVMPTPDDVRSLIEFSESVDSEQHRHVIIHCQQGISRSTAAAMILLWRHGRLDDALASGVLFALRPVFWPNSRMLVLADELLGARGELVSAGLRLRRQAFA